VSRGPMADCKLGCHDAINIFLGNTGSQPRLGSLGAAGGQYGGAVIAQAAGQGMATWQGSLMPATGRGGRKILEITCLGPAQAVVGRAGGQTNVFGHFQSADEWPGMGSEHAPVLGAPTVSVRRLESPRLAQRQYPHSGRKEHPRPTPGSWWR